ncbi:MAG: aldehyde dehydrogenase [Candidatus Kapabacteria bacterium]|nr:aldehyde dehydrogenase [Candidatus Kapabacteria bacterium]
MKSILNYCDGELCDAIGGAWLDNYEPATGKVYSRLPASDARDVERAVNAASVAFPLWSALTPDERSVYMLRIAALLEARIEDFIRAESQDQGKPEWLARVMDIPRAVANLRFFATEILHTSTSAHETSSTVLNYTLRKPLGVVGCISPWNLPLYLFTWKIAPALAAGNTVVAKQSELTPMTAFMLAELCIEAGLPKGVLNIIHGMGADVGAAIVESSAVKAISFTGSTRTGEYIARTAAPKFKKLSLELGGKNPNIVFADCNFEKAVRESVRAAFHNQGEICLCGSRIFIERGIYDRFRDEFVRQTAALQVGDPMNETSRVGALVSRDHYEKVLSYIALAKEEGGTILTGGSIVNIDGRCSEGWFIAPTVIEGLTYDCRTNQEEIFGPVVTLVPFDSEDEAVMMANSTGYGLTAILWTENLNRAHRVAAAMESGIVWVNCWLVRDLRTPFGGVKNSGVGREGGVEALRFFTEPKNVCISFGT